MNPNQRLQPLVQQTCLLAAQQSQPLTRSGLFRNLWLSNRCAPFGSPTGAQPLAIQQVRNKSRSLEPDSKRIRPGRELRLRSEPESSRPRPRPRPDPAPAGRRRQRRRAHVCTCIVPSFSRAKTPSTQRAHPLFSIFSIYTTQASIPRPMWD